MMKLVITAFELAAAFLAGFVAARVELPTLWFLSLLLIITAFANIVRQK